MAKSKNVKHKRPAKQKQPKPKPIAISGHKLYNKSGHLITSRPYGTPARQSVLFAFAFLSFMVIMSFGVLYTTPLSPAVWATITFFAGLLILLLIQEENIFPSLCKEKKIWAVCAWFLAFMIAPYVAMNVSYFSFPLFLIVITFFIILIPIITRIVIPEDKWVEVKENVKDKVLHPVPSKKKGKKNKNNGLTGINRKRKIYRR
jgi:hypothetical protein